MDANILFSQALGERDFNMLYGVVLFTALLTMVTLLLVRGRGTAPHPGCTGPRNRSGRQHETGDRRR